MNELKDLKKSNLLSNILLSVDIKKFDIKLLEYNESIYFLLVSKKLKF